MNKAAKPPRSGPLFTNGGAPNVYNMPAGTPFLDNLARGLSEHLGERLSDALILLPTRRAVRELGEAFVRYANVRRGGAARHAALLPMMRPLADVDPEEPPFEPGELAHTITPAIDSVTRLFQLSRLALAKEQSLHGRAPDPAAALALAQPLLSVLDDAAMEELSLAQLSKLDPIIDMSAKHYEQAAVFYKIVQQYWPQYLRDNNLMDPMQRRVALLRALAEQWEARAPDHPVIIAGSTGTLAATANLMRVVACQKDGLIVLPGLDSHIDDETVWSAIKDGHPQASLKRLLDTLGLPRGKVRLWSQPKASFEVDSRRRLISEAMIPAETTADWLQRVKTIRKAVPQGDPIAAGLSGLSLVQARNDDEEASVIALAMRRVLEDEQASAALVTPDPALGRRVRAKLSRWGVEVDVSAGQPLEETSIGAYLALLLQLAANPWDAVALAAIFKHPLTTMSRRAREVTRSWSRLELAGFRGVAPNSYEALRARYLIAKAAPNFEPDIALLAELHAALEPLSKALSKKGSIKDAVIAHVTLAETLARREHGGQAQHGAARLWRGEDGEAASKLMLELGDKGHILGDVDLDGYARLLSSLMRGRVVRPRFGTHPRLQILGPLEARMLSADLVILGGLNEGVWPSAAKIDPLLSYAMRQEIGLSSPERRFGLSAHDFAQLAAHKNVLMTRSLKTDDGPSVASRWVWRLKTLIRGALGEDEAKTALEPEQPLLSWARALDHVPASDVNPATPPAPRPALSKRWPKGRQISVTAVEMWGRDPYALYARTILGLRSLDPLGQDIGPREYGSAIHKGVEAFARRYAKDVPDKAAQWLAGELETRLLQAGFEPSALAAQRVRLTRIADWLTAWEQERRARGIYPVGIEVKGQTSIYDAPGGEFTLKAEADRIDKGLDGYNIIDYKTGLPPGVKQVWAGFSPQLPLEGVILEGAGFDGVSAGPPFDFTYVQLTGRSQAGKATSILGKDRTAQDHTAKSYEGLLQLITLFDDPDTAYRSQPRAKNVNPYGDYDQLARRAEWASASDEDGGAHE